MPKIHLVKYNKKIVDKKDNKDILIDLSTFIIIGVDDRILSTNYTSVEDRMLYNEVYDKTELIIISDEVNESKVKKDGMSRFQLPRGE